MTRSASRLRTVDLAYIALFAALLALCAWISVPFFEVPFTLQTFGVFAAMLMLGGRRGSMAVTVYLLLGAAGLPVFAGFKGGLGALAGVTGGYLVGFLVLAAVYTGVTALLGDSEAAGIAGCVLGLAACYAFGTVWFLLVYARTAGTIGLTAILAKCVFPFLLPDAVKLALAAALSRRLKPMLK